VLYKLSIFSFTNLYPPFTLIWRLRLVNMLCSFLYTYIVMCVCVCICAELFTCFTSTTPWLTVSVHTGSWLGLWCTKVSYHSHSWHFAWYSVCSFRIREPHVVITVYFCITYVNFRYFSYVLYHTHVHIMIPIITLPLAWSVITMLRTFLFYIVPSLSCY